MIDVIRPAVAEFEFHGNYIDFALPDNPGEECGVIGIYLTVEGEKALNEQGISMQGMLYRGLKRQVHRGRQNTGMGISEDGQYMEVVTGVGPPEEAFQDGDALSGLPSRGRYGLAHNRYATVGGLKGGQPTDIDGLRMVTNGQYPNYRELAAHLSPGRRNQPTDSWVNTGLVADKIDEGYSAPGAMVVTSEIGEGAFSTVAFYDGELIGMRDPRGMRPLVLGRMGTYGYAFASERATLKVMGFTPERDVNPGEIIVINDKEGVASVEYATPDLKECVFEKVYLGDPDRQRYNSGKILAREAPADADMVIPVPRSAYATAHGYADESGIPFTPAIKKIRRDRTFMADGEGSKTIYRLKRGLVEGKRKVIVDDSIVRQNTVKVLGQVFQITGGEVHMRIGSPPIKWPCFYGVATPNREGLIANWRTPDQLRDDHGFKSLQYLSEKGLIEAFGKKVCNACITGDYPTKEGYDQANGKTMLPVLTVTAHA